MRFSPKNAENETGLSLHVRDQLFNYYGKEKPQRLGELSLNRSISSERGEEENYHRKNKS